MDSLPDLDHLEFLRSQQKETSTGPGTVEDLGILDISSVEFRDDENWLVESPGKIDLNKWLNSNEEPAQTSPKVFDSRTFTRRRIARPSLFDKNDSTFTENVTEEAAPVSLKPNFDITRPDPSSYFDNLVANTGNTLDSFINMSPPSLVDSMSSSTFNNLMENSYIKNDPTLRQIRDTDFTVSILQQETEPMLESYSSLNSELMDTLLKNETVAISKSSSISTSDLGCEGSGSNSEDNLNRTFQANQNVQDTTFSRGQQNKAILDSTFSKGQNHTIVIQEKERINATITLESNLSRRIEDKPVESVKRLLNRRPSPSMDLNRLSYIEDRNETVLNQNKRNSFGSSDSLENGDYMSLSSGSSKSSHRGSITNRERYLQHTFSTPKTIPKKTFSTWSSCDISPISGRNSDPELSSTEKSLPIPIVNTTIRKQKSVGQLNRQIPEFTKMRGIGQVNQKGSNPDLRSGLRKPTNLNSMTHTLKGSYTSLKPLCTNLPIAPPPLNPANVTTTLVAPSRQVQVEATKTENAQFVRPKPVRPSALPRPASRIPGPRTIRPPSKSSGHHGAANVP